MKTCEIVLACKCVHFKRAPVGVALPPNTVFPCLFHGYQPVKAIYGQEWRMRCFYTGLDGAVCRYGRWCGQSRATARRLARNHTNRIMSRDHPVMVAYDTITRDGRGLILRSDSRLPTDTTVETFGLTRTVAGNQTVLPIYTVSGTVGSSAVETLPPPF